MAQLARKNGELGVVITSINEQGIEKRKFITLKKILVKGLLPVGLRIGIGVGVLAAGFATGKAVAENYQTQDEKNQEALANLDENEQFIEEHLANYSIALSEYESIMSQPNHNEHYAIEKRVELISAIRNLQGVADNLMKTKVLEGLEITAPECKVEIERVNDGGNVAPVDTIKVTKDNEDVYYTTSVPADISNILNFEEAISVYEGNGENAKWEDAINKFIKEGNGLYNSILNLTTKNFIYENGNLKSVEQAKSI